MRRSVYRRGPRIVVFGILHQRPDVLHQQHLPHRDCRDRDQQAEEAHQRAAAEQVRQARQALHDAVTDDVVNEGQIRGAANVLGVTMPSRYSSEGSITDAEGEPTTDVEDYYAGGAILPLGFPATGHKGIYQKSFSDLSTGAPATNRVSRPAEG